MNLDIFRGVKVIHVGKEAVIKKIETNRVYIVENDMNNKTEYELVFPDAFFETESNKRFLVTEDRRLLLELSRLSNEKTCNSCGKYIPQYSLKIGNYSKKKLCESCFEIEEKKHQRCSRCNNISLIENGGRDCVGAFLCKSCYEKRIRHKQINLISRSVNPVLIVSQKKPVKYQKCKLQLFRARVLFVKDNRLEPHEVDLFYCQDYNVYICYFTMLYSYQEKFGTLLMDKQFEFNSGFVASWLNKCDRDYNPDSLLSRWGYVAQLDKQTTEERRIILKCILNYNETYKAQIVGLLNSFIENRDRCQYAIPLWKSDLDFVLAYNVGEPFVDLTDVINAFE